MKPNHRDDMIITTMACSMEALLQNKKLRNSIQKNNNQLHLTPNLELIPNPEKDILITFGDGWFEGDAK